MNDTTALVIGFSVIALAIYGVIKIIKSLVKRVKKDSGVAAEPRVKPKLDEKNIEVTLPHVYGLPIAENQNCTIISCEDKIEMSSQGAVITLDKEKITDISIHTDAEIQQQYVSSVGGAVGGAVLFGPLGAMIGGRAKKKSTTTMTKYLIISYLKDGKPEYIGFNALFGMGNAKKLVNEFVQSKVDNKVKIDL